MTLTIVPDMALVASRTAPPPIPPCRSGLDPDIWFPRPSDKRGVRLAAELCAPCPVREACLQVALDANIQYGIWGGLTPNQRRPLDRKHPCRRCQSPCALRSRYCGDTCRQAARLASRASYEGRRNYRRAA